MIPATIFNQKVTIKRRQSTGTDTLGNPIYGTPTGGPGWSNVYVQMPVRLAFSAKIIRFAIEGERVQPTGTMYYNPQYSLLPEDRVITQEGIEYNIISIVKGQTFGEVISHFEAIVQLP